MSTTTTIAKGTLGYPPNKTLSRVVGYSDKAKGGVITDERGPRSAYVVFVEQTGDYRMGRVRIGAWQSGGGR